MSYYPTADPRSVIGHVPGRICVGPTDLSLDYPHGGEGLGEIGDCYITNLRPRTIIRDENTGFDPVEIISHGESLALFLLIREHSSNAYQRFLGSGAGSVTGSPLVQSTAGERAGLLNVDEAEAYLFSPYDTVNDPAVYIPNGVPLIEETLRINAMLGAEGDRWAVSAVVEAIRRPGDDLIWSCGRLEDLTL